MSIKRAHFFTRDALNSTCRLLSATTDAGNRDRRRLIGFALRNSEYLLHSQHFSVDLLDLRHEHFLFLGEPNEFFQRRARNIPQHSVILTRKIDNATAGVSSALRWDLIGLVHRGKDAAGHDQHSTGQSEGDYPNRRDYR